MRARRPAAGQLGARGQDQDQGRDRDRPAFLASQPIRALAAGTLLRTVGRGLFVTVSVLYLTRSVGLDVAHVGTGLTLAALGGVLAGMPAGRLADLRGPRTTAVVFAALEAFALVGYTAVGGFVSLLAVAGLLAVFESAALTSRGALIAAVVPSGQRVGVRARLRVITNIGWSVGAAIAAIALGLDNRAGYVAMILGAAACHLGSALVTLRVPTVPGSGTGSGTGLGTGVGTGARVVGSRWLALGDRPYTALTALNAILCLHDGITSIAIPVWVAQHTRAPLSIVAALLVTNTVLVILLQVRASRGTETVAGGARAQRRAGGLFLLACLLYATTAGVPATAAVALLLAAAALHAVGEVLHSAGAWSLSYELAQEHAQGQYQGLYGMSVSVANVVAPITLTVLMTTLDQAGWILLGCVFLAAGSAVPAVARWASATRTSHREPVPDHVCRAAR